MKKFLAKIIFNIKFEGNERSHFDEQVRVIKAITLEDAFFKARKIGKSEEETFPDARNQPVTWKFIDVAELYPLDEIPDGEQLYSRTHILEDSATYIKHIRSRSMEIQAKSLTFA